MMNARRKSDRRIVPKKRPNKGGETSAEAVEARGLAEGNASQGAVCRAQKRKAALAGLDRVREVANRDRETRFTTLLHHVHRDRLEETYQGLNRKASPGVDGETWSSYGKDLEANLEELLGRIHRGSYRPKPSKRQYIPKTDGRRRPLGIAALEDKIVQGAVKEVLESIYEEDFLGFSYGFRPKRGCHDALDALAVGIERRPVNWVLDADIRGFFDAMDHGWLMRFVEHRVADSRILRLIQRWLDAGVLEEGRWQSSPRGTPQGATISPLLANIYLHYVLDLWAAQWRRTQAKGAVILVRYADDFVVGFEHREDAERFLNELRERLQRFALELHPRKTRLIEFGRNAAQDRRDRGDDPPESFDFLGFTHICGQSLRGGRFQLVRKTMRSRLRQTLKEIRATLRRRRHRPVPEIGRWLRQVICGYDQYHAVPTNYETLLIFRREVLKAWQRALRRRSQRSKTNWKRMERLARTWIPRPRILHPWPNQRLRV